MQPLVLHPPSLTSTQFGQPRFTGPGLPFTRPWSNTRGCSPRAPLSRQSMSGSPPAEPSVTSGESNPPIYPPAPAPVAATSAEATANLPGPSQPLPPPPVSEPLAPPVLSRYGEPNTPVFANSPQLPPGAPAYPLPALDPSASGSASRALTQKSTRRTKAHVASACVNCKKKHLGCDPARPCRRCVLAGKAVSIQFHFMHRCSRTTRMKLTPVPSLPAWMSPIKSEDVHHSKQRTRPFGHIQPTWTTQPSLRRFSYPGLHREPALCIGPRPPVSCGP